MGTARRLPGAASPAELELEQELAGALARAGLDHAVVDAAVARPARRPRTRRGGWVPRADLRRRARLLAPEPLDLAPLHARATGLPVLAIRPRANGQGHPGRPRAGCAPRARPSCRSGRRR